MWFEKNTKNKYLKILAPMADMTDAPFCTVCREVAGNDFIIYREMVSSEAIVRENEKTLKMCKISNKERPIIQQVFGSEPKVITESAKIIMDRFSPDGIDINMGCPVPKIAKKGLAGAALLKDHNRAVSIIKSLKRADLGVEISVKTRLGWSDKAEILKFAPKLQEAGADLICIHGRTRKQGFQGQSDWKQIGKVKNILSIPVIANGDIKNNFDMEECIRQSGVDGIMIGRGALGNPWIFLEGERQISSDQKINVILRHGELHEKHYGEGSLISFRKHLLWYFKANRMPGIRNIKKIRSELVKVRSRKDLEIILRKIKNPA
ncbi:MAG: tRNA dihydrouridine synthase DusB [Candidatus Magasanikbacteria bacterium]|nr:tRNA dihydrouridine synthase DusB [Candidatus Magasanikbacteria bacterium]